jgi:hypothetical protein
MKYDAKVKMLPTLSASLQRGSESSLVGKQFIETMEFWDVQGPNNKNKAVSDLSLRTDGRFDVNLCYPTQIQNNRAKC